MDKFLAKKLRYYQEFVKIDEIIRLFKYDYISYDVVVEAAAEERARAFPTCARAFNTRFPSRTTRRMTSKLNTCSYNNMALSMLQTQRDGE